MASVTRVEDGLWFVNFPEFELHTDNIHFRDFQLKHINYAVELTVTDYLAQCGHSLVKGKVTAIQINDEGRLPRTISAITNGNLHEMMLLENGVSGQVQWLYLPSTNRCSLQLIIKDQHSDRRQHIPPHFAHLFDSRVMADVKFLVKGEEIGAHLAIVVSASPVMAAMLEPDKFKEGLTRTVTIDDIEPSVFKELLRYVYTGSVQNLEQNGEPLFVAADKYQIQRLKELCTEQLIKQLDMNNAVRYLVLGHLHSVSRLLEASLQCLENNKKELWSRTDWKDFAQNYPEFFYQVTGRMVK